MKKINEKVQRVKYMRLHEKLLQSSMTILKLESFNYLMFEKKSRNIYKKIENIPDIRADSTYLRSLRNFGILLMSTLNNENYNPQKKREILLKEVNLLHKQKNKSIYKRSKKIDRDE